ncbi:MAG: hypothetical protein HRT69_14690 [Flavobacteriaceae bacterium]|nr:hypothetical protein [Flavobacteriaceae bacterium]
MNTAVINTYSQGGQSDDNSFTYYCKFNNNTFDEVGNLIPITNTLTFEASSNDQAAIFNSVNDLVLPSDDAFLFSDGTNDIPFSIVIHLKRDATGNVYILSQSAESYRVYLFGNTIRLAILSQNSWSNFIYSIATVTTPTGTYFTSIITYDGTGIGGIKIYQDGVGVTGTNVEVGTYVSMKSTIDTTSIGEAYTGGNSFIGKIDTIAVLKKELTPTEVTDIHSKLINGDSLI